MTEYTKILNGNLVLAIKARYCDSFWSKLKGLMFSRPLKHGEGIVLFAPYESVLSTTVHMLFVFFPIDIVWLNSTKKVVDIRKNVLPFMPFVIPRKAAKYVVELPKDGAKDIKIGGRLRFKRI